MSFLQNSIETYLPDGVCVQCIQDLIIAYKFKKRCEYAFQHLLNVLNQKDEFNVEVENAVVIETEEINKIIEASDDAEKSQINQIKIIKKENYTLDSNGKKKFTCEECNRTFSRSTHLRRHMTIHTDERAFDCDICEKKFRRLDHLQTHLKQHAQLKPHQCNNCDKSFSRSDHLRNHIAARHTEKPLNTNVFKCTACNREFTSEKVFKSHEKTHAIKVFQCKDCTETFNSKNDLTKHISKSHSHDKPFLCSECGLRFVRNDYLMVHLRRHRGETRYHCKYCNKGFFRATDVRVHEKYHTNEKTHICTVCGKGFERSYNLSVHLRVHTGKRKDVCGINSSRK